MDYKGAGVRLRNGELAELASHYGLREAHLRTVIEVETSGKGFNSAGWVEFLFEPHRFYANLKSQPDKLKQAIASGCAYPTWRGPGSYPKTLQLRIQQFQRAASIDETAAIKSASWGLGQIMGEECVEVGYSSPQAMLAAFADSERNQVEGMLRLIRHRGIDKDLLNFPNMDACRHFALRYNGRAYEKNNYHVKLHDAFIRWNGREATHGTTDPMADGTISFGECDIEQKGGPIWQMQQRLKDLGYSLVVDGKYGGGTRATVLAWKANEGISTSSPDMGPTDLEMLKRSNPMPVPAVRAAATVEDLKPSSSIVQKTSLGKKILGWLGIGSATVGATGSTGVLDKAQDAADKAEQAKGILGTFSNLLGDTGLATALSFIYEWRFPLLLVGVVVAFILFNQIQQKRLEMHRRAEIG